MKIGQLVMKTCGRDGNNIAIVVDKISDNYVLIDGNVRRKKCNIKHLEIIPEKILKIKKAASTSEVKKAMQQAGIKLIKKGAKRKPSKKPIKKRKQKPVKESKEVKKKQPKQSKQNA